KKRDHRMLLVKNSNTRQIGVKTHRQGEIHNLGTKRGLPPELNSGRIGCILFKKKFRGIGLFNSDAEFPGDETDDEDDLPYLDLSELLQVPLHVVCVLPVSFGANLFLRTNLDPVMVLLIVIGSVLAKKLFSTRTSLLNPPGLSAKALGKRKVFDDAVKPHVKRDRPAKPRPSTVLANSSTSRHHRHVSHTHHDAYHAQNLYEARDNHLIPDSVRQHELFSRTSAVSASGLSTRFGGPQGSNNLVKIPSSQGNQNGHIHQFYSPHAHVQTSTQTNAHIPGLTSPPPIAVVGNPFLGDGAESGVEAEAIIGQRGHDEPDTHCDDLKWAAEKILVLLQNDPQQTKAVIEMLQLQRPGQTIAAGIGHDITNRNPSVHGDHRGVGEWLVPSLGTGRIPEAGDQVNSGIEPGLYSGLSRSSRAGIEISTPDHPAVQFGQQKHTSMPPDAGSNATIHQSLYLVLRRGQARYLVPLLTCRIHNNGAGDDKSKESFSRSASAEGVPWGKRD
ncbi:hypothetical protein F5877DRAFT_73311, partial [Lentinula edodes]